MSGTNLLNFDSMITPKIITFVYWVLLILIIAVSISYTIGSDNPVYGLIVLFCGVLFLRIWCELLIVLFKINENIQILANKAVAVESPSQQKSSHILDEQI